MDVKPVFSLLFPELKTEYFLTGSEVYATPTAESDIDVMIQDDDGSEQSYVEARLKIFDLPIERSNVFSCIKFPILDKKINLIFLDQVNFIAWKCATKALAASKRVYDLDKRSPVFVLQKAFRCKLFRELVVEFGGAITTQTYSSETQQIFSP